MNLQGSILPDGGGVDATACPLLKYSRRFHISNTTTTLAVWKRGVLFWKGLRKLEAETIVVWTNVWLQRRCFGYTQETH